MSRAAAVGLFPDRYRLRRGGRASVNVRWWRRLLTRVFCCIFGLDLIFCRRITPGVGDPRCHSAVDGTGRPSVLRNGGWLKHVGITGPYFVATARPSKLIPTQAARTKLAAQLAALARPAKVSSGASQRPSRSLKGGGAQKCCLTRPVNVSTGWFEAKNATLGTDTRRRFVEPRLARATRGRSQNVGSAAVDHRAGPTRVRAGTRLVSRPVA